MSMEMLVAIGATIIFFMIGNEILTLAVISAWMVKFLTWFCGQAFKGF